MTDILFDPGERLSPAMACSLDDRLCPDTYAVVHLKRREEGIRGTLSIFEAEAVKVLARVSAAVLGKREYRRRPDRHRFIPNLVTLEYGVDDNPHLNFLFRRGPEIPLDRLSAALRRKWERSLWSSASGEQWFYCEDREPGSRVVGYCSKEGAGSLLVKTLTF